MKNGTFIPVTRVQSRPDVKSDGKARFGDNNPTITQQGIDVDKFISDNHGAFTSDESKEFLAQVCRKTRLIQSGTGTGGA